MTNPWLLVLALAACDTSADLLATSDLSSDLPLVTVNISGFAVDPLLLDDSVELHPDWTPAMLFAAAAIASAPIFARYDDGMMSRMVLSDASGHFTLPVAANTTVHLCSGPTDAIIASCSEDPVLTSNLGADNAVARVIEASPRLPLDGVAAATGGSVPDLVARGACLLAFESPGTPPTLPHADTKLVFTDLSGANGYQLWAVTDYTQTPPMVAQQAESTVGLFVVTAPAGAAKTTVQLQATSVANPSGPPSSIACDVVPAVVTFGATISQ